MQVPEKRQACLRMMITITRTEDTKRLEEVIQKVQKRQKYMSSR